MYDLHKFEFRHSISQTNPGLYDLQFLNKKRVVAQVDVDYL